MNFAEILTQTRKQRGLSQEALAEKVQVSRQAVSKWETGDASPDLAKLLLLADALGISLDELCGRKSICANAAALPDRCGKAPRRRIALPILTAVLFLCSLLCFAAAARLQKTHSASAGALPLPDAVGVSGVGFGVDDHGKITYSFVPSVTDDALSYQITFTDTSGASETFDATMSGGVCSGSVSLSEYESYLVTVTVRSKETGRSIPIARSMSFSADGTSWLPIGE